MQVGRRQRMQHVVKRDMEERNGIKLKARSLGEYVDKGVVTPQQVHNLHDSLVAAHETSVHGHPSDYVVMFCIFPIWVIIILVVISSADADQCDQPLSTFLALRLVAYIILIIVMLVGMLPALVDHALAFLTTGRVCTC